MSAERLQKVLARAGVGSRRQVEQLIREGRITVNGRLAVLGERADLAADAVKVDGRRVQPVRRWHRYVLLNKPRGCVSTLSDPEGRPTILDHVPQRLRPGLKPVGRLDFDTEGLILLTDDGELAHRLAHPRYGCAKTYEVKVKGRPSETSLARLRGGILLDGRRTAPASVAPRPTVRRGGRESRKNSWWTVILKEGRTRQIREMFFRVGHPVSRLRRLAIGPLEDGRLARGAWRELEEREVAMLRRAVGLEDPSRKTPKRGTPKRGTPKRGTPKRRSDDTPGRRPPAGSGPAGPRKTRPRPAGKRGAGGRRRDGHG